MRKFLFQITLLFLLLFGDQTAYGQSRTILGINDGWEFTKENIVPGSNLDSLVVNWETVCLPHSWNSTDVMDDKPGYYRGIGWYRKKLLLNVSNKHKQIYLRFEGANQLTTAYINGKVAGTHTGGYTAFQLPIHSLIKFDSTGNKNEILVKVDNSHNLQVPPLSADFSFFGGLYRDAWLITTEPVHFSLNDHGSDGVFISTPEVNATNAKINIRGNITNTLRSVAKVKIRSIILDRDGQKQKEIQTLLSIKPGSENNFKQDISSFIKPRLWSTDDPYLYTVTTTIYDAVSGQLLDEVINPIGFRWFAFDTAKGFFLNGEAVKLVGASRHQDRPGMGNAVPDEYARQDVEWLKEMGGNFLRVAHYPQDPSVLEACDKLGILASVEIPLVNEITESDSFYQHCETMQVEMIRQSFNHPSVILWCYMNEILLRPHFNNDKERQKIYFNNITKLAKRLDSITRLEDPYRYTMIANHGDFDRYRNAGLTDIPMVVGWNLYSGWYGGELENFPAFLDKHHQLLPSKPMVVAEYGADADPRIRSFHPVRFDKSVEYTTRFHQYYLQEMLKRPFVAGAMIWNLADFNSETREETMPHINNKGLLTWNRTPKDPYYFYQAMLTQKPFIKIASAYWNKRTGTAENDSKVCYQPLQVASNLDSIELIVNGTSQGWKKPQQGLCEWNIPFINEWNMIEAKGIQRGKWYTDQSTVQFQLQPYFLHDTVLRFKELNILLGADRYFFDTKTEQIWQPDQPYHAGSWGYIGGKPFKMATNNRLPYGTDKDILGTDNDPVYQTQQTGISSYRLDVPAGEYEVILHFAEIQNNTAKNIPYNLSPSKQEKQNLCRSFNVYINDKLLLENFDIAAQYGIVRAVSQKLIVPVKKEGIRLVFEPVSGEPVLNALQVRKVY